VPSLVLLCILRLTFGVAFNLFTSTIQSSISQNSPLATQGRTTGMVETSWTLAAVTFVLHGFMIKEYGWKAPFVRARSCECSPSLPPFTPHPPPPPHSPPRRFRW
jgi:predicted MFS family arabinose efflux permease